MKNLLISVLTVGLFTFANTGSAQFARAEFNVNKEFTDGSEESVKVQMSCPGGIPVLQSQTFSGAANLEFVVVDFVHRGITCVVTEQAVPGYVATYDNNLGNINVNDCTYPDVEWNESYT